MTSWSERNGKSGLNKTTLHSKSKTSGTEIDYGIVYFKRDYLSGEHIKEENAVLIGSSKAMVELKKLSSHRKSIIGFKNNQNGDFLEMIPLSENKWRLDVGVPDKRVFEGEFTFIAIVNDKEVFTMLRLFFENEAWFDLVDWKMKRLGSQNKEIRTI